MLYLYTYPPHTKFLATPLDHPVHNPVHVIYLKYNTYIMIVERGFDFTGANCRAIAVHQ